MPTTARLYEPSDTVLAYESWKASCGPAAFAAVLGREVMDCRGFFPGFPAKTWCNPTQMREALDAAQVPYRLTQKNADGQAAAPAFGLCFIQIDGPWCDPGRPIAAAYRHTHWVGFMLGRGPKGVNLVFDINSPEWLPADEWEQNTLSQIIAHLKGNGHWWVRTGIEVQR